MHSLSGNCCDISDTCQHSRVKGGLEKEKEMKEQKERKGKRKEKGKGKRKGKESGKGRWKEEGEDR